MHQKRSISLVSTQFYHFHFHPLAGLNCYPHLISCLKNNKGLLSKRTLYPKLSTVSRAYLNIFRRHWSRRHHLSSSASSWAAFLCVAFIATLLDSIEPVSGKEEIFKEKGKLNKLLLTIYICNKNNATIADGVDFAKSLQSQLPDKSLDKGQWVVRNQIFA